MTGMRIRPWVHGLPLATESGASLRASGFRPSAHVKGRQWDTPARRRFHRPTPDRIRWEKP